MGNKIVDTAKKYVGYNEGDGTFKCFIDTYNTLETLPRGYKAKYSDAWCAIFVTAIGIECGMTDIILPECGCERMIELYKAQGRFIEDDDYTPKSGDLIFYDWQDSGKGDCDGWADHVGIVESVSKSQITAIEGNKSDSVARRKIKINSQYIRGFAVPNYPDEEIEKNHDTNKDAGTIAADPKKSIDDIALEVIRGEWSNDPDRTNKLTLAGYDAKAVQARVNEILAEKNKRTGVVRVNSCLRVRTSPSTANNNNIITTLSNGTKVDISEERGGWYHITSPRDGWVSANYVVVN